MSQDVLTLLHKIILYGQDRITHVTRMLNIM